MNGVEPYYEETGQGFPLVWSHEFAGDHRSWEPQVRYFSRREARPEMIFEWSGVGDGRASRSRRRGEPVNPRRAKPRARREARPEMIFEWSGVGERERARREARPE